MAELYPPQELPQLELPQQEPSTTPTPPDYPTKRTKFLAKFSQLDPDAKLDEENLGAILSDEAKRDEFTSYVGKLNPKFTMSGQELADALGYESKKKASTIPSGEPAAPSASASLPAGDAEFQPVAPLETAQAFQPGTASAPLALNADSLATGEVATPRAPAQEEADYLGKLPATEDKGIRADGSEYDPTPYGKELVAIPNDYTGAVPPGTFELNLAGKGDRTQYFYRDLKKNVDGKEQSYGEALQGKIKNALYNMGQGIVEGAGAVENTIMGAGGGVGSEFRDTGADQASTAIEQSKTPVAPYYNQSFGKHKNWETLGLSAAEYAPMVLAQVAQTLAPELRAPAALQKAIGLAATTGFDADMYHAAHEHAKQIFPSDPSKADLYTLYEGTLVVAGFKAGSKLMSDLGDHLAEKIAPKEFVERVAADAAEATAKLEKAAGRAATAAEGQKILHDSLRAALPKLAQLPKEAFQQGGTFGTTEFFKTVGNQLVAPALGGKADDLGPNELAGLASRVGEAAAGGATMGLLTGAVGAVLPTGSTPAPAEVPSEVEQKVTEAVAPTEQTLPVPMQTEQVADFNPLLESELKSTQPGNGDTLLSNTESAPSQVEEISESRQALLPTAEPHPDHIKPLTPQLQAANDALDALDRYNALDKRAKKGKEGNAARGEIARAAAKGGLSLTVDNDYKATLTREGKRATRSNEYTATTPAANYVSLAERPEAVQPFLKNVLAAAEQSPAVIQGIGVELRGKQLSARELTGAVEDIKVGKNTLRAQLVLDALENAHRKGYVEKSEGNGLATRKYTVPVEEYVGEAVPSPAHETRLADQDIDKLIAEDAALATALDDYTDPTTGELNYAKLASDGAALPFLFGVSDDIATKITSLAYERAPNPQPSKPASQPSGIRIGPEPINEADAFGRNAPESVSPTTGVEQASTGATTTTREVASLSAQKRAKIQASIEEAAERIRARREARRQEGKLFSSPLGIGEIDPEDLTDALTIAKGHIKLGVLKAKGLIAEIRAAGLDEQAAPDELLRPHLKKLLAKESPAAKTTKARRHATRYDARTRRAFTEDEARYTPKTLIENEATAHAYVRQMGLESAYAVALSKPEGFSSAAHIEVQEAVAREYRRLSDEAHKAGNPAEAEQFWQRSKDVRAVKVSALTEAGQTLAQVKGFIADDPDSVLDLAIKETERQKKPLLQKVEKAGVKVAQVAARARRSIMDSALKAATVRQVREQIAPTEPTEETPKPELLGYGLTNKYFTKSKALQAREALRKLGLSTIVPPELVQLVGYHVEALARAGGKHSFAEVSKRIVRELGAKVKPFLPEAYEQARQAYAKNGGTDKGFTSPEEVAALIVPSAVKGGLQQLGTTLDRIAREHAEGMNMKGRTLAGRFVAEAGLAPKQANVYAQAVEAEFNRQVLAKKAGLRAKLLTFSTRVLLGRNATTAVDKLLTTLNLAVDPTSAGELLKKQLNLPDITPAQADHFTKLAEAVRKARPGSDRSDRVQDLMKALGKIEHVNLYTATEAMWYANTLSGPLTHVGNLTANAKETIAENLISTLHTLAETGSLRAATAPTRGAYQAQRRALAEAAKIIQTGYTGNQSEKFGHNNYLENKDFKGVAAPLNGLKYIGRALAGEDAYFNLTLRGMRSQEMALKEAYREITKQASLNGEKLSSADTYQRAWHTALSKLYGIADLRAAAEAQATAEGVTDRVARSRRISALVNQQVQKQQAKWATIAEAEGLFGVAKQQRMGELQEQSQPATLVADAKQFAELHTFNGPPEGTLGAVASLIGKLGEIPVGGTKPFKLLAPFTRILSSVQNRRLDWTPVGILRAVKGSTGSKDYQGGHFYRELSPEEREKSYLRGTLGTLTTLGFYALAKAGYVTITGISYGDKDQNALRPPASIRWGNSGLFTSYQGDINELGLAAVGNILAWEAREEKAGRKADPTKRLLVVAGLTAMHTADLGPTKGVSEGLENLMSMAKNPDRAGSYMARMGISTTKGLLPYSAAVTQALRGLNILLGESEKENVSDNAWEATYNSLLLDVPVARNRQQDAVDLLGSPIKVSSTRIWGWMPERSAEDQAALDFLAQHDLIPVRSRATDDNLTYWDAATGKMRGMTGEEFYKFQVAKGQEFGRLLREAMRKPSENPDLTSRQRQLIRQYDAEGNKALPDMTLKEARKVVSEAYKQAVEAGKVAVFGSDVVPVGVN
jgi:hypothetical protein